MLVLVAQVGETLPNDSPAGDPLNSDHDNDGAIAATIARRTLQLATSSAGRTLGWRSTSELPHSGHRCYRTRQAAARRLPGTSKLGQRALRELSVVTSPGPCCADIAAACCWLRCQKALTETQNEYSVYSFRKQAKCRSLLEEHWGSIAEEKEPCNLKLMNSVEEELAPHQPEDPSAKPCKDLSVDQRRAQQTAERIGPQALMPRSSGSGTHPPVWSAPMRRVPLGEEQVQSSAERNEGTRPQQNMHRVTAARQTGAGELQETPGRNHVLRRSRAEKALVSRSRYPHDQVSSWRSTRRMPIPPQHAAHVVEERKGPNPEVNCRRRVDLIIDGSARNHRRWPGRKCHV